MLYKIFLLLSTFLVAACTGETRSEQVSVDLLKLDTDSLNYSVFADAVEYIPLETNGSCLIGTVSDVQITKNRVFVLDKRMQTIWMFDKQGKYRGKLFKQGNGPGEYANVRQFEFHEQTGELAVLDMWTNKILFYDLNGNFIKAIAPEVRAMDFKFAANGGLVISQAGMDAEGAGIYLTDAAGKTIKQLLKRNEEQLIFLDTEWELCTVDGETRFMEPNFGNRLYALEGEEAVVRLPIEMLPAVQRVYEKDFPLQQLEDFLRTEYVDSSRWLYATYWSAVHGTRAFLFDKETGESRVGKSLANDLQGRLCSGKTSATQDNCFVFWCENEVPDLNPVLQVLHLK